jgi:mevalonate kinase
VAQACAKFILGGEHSIVQRGVAIAFPVHSLRLSVRETPSARPSLTVNAEHASDFVARELWALRKSLAPAARADVALEIKSSIPQGAGLGSSAALCTALARLHRPELSSEELARCALEGERRFHARPSGIDPFTVAFEKALLFRAQDLSYRFLQSEAFSDAGLCFVLVDSGAQHSTSKVQFEVEALKRKSPVLWEQIIEQLAQNAHEMAPAFEGAQAERLGKLMNDSQARLRELGVSTPALETICSRLLEHGAWGAKLSGAGCGGFAVGLFDRQSWSKAQAALEASLGEAQDSLAAKSFIGWP